MQSRLRAVAAALAACAAVGVAAAPAVAKAPTRAGSHRTTVHRAKVHRTKIHREHSRSATGVYDALPVTRGSGYLALGDSVPFGYQEPQVVPAPDYSDASSFPNYPDMLGQELGLTVANLACPGETTSSFIDTSAISNGCENTLGDTSESYRAMYPLHYQYSGSQLSAAIAYLEANKNVRLVSLMIGANDVFVCQETTADDCTSKSELLAVAKQIATNVGTILSDLRTEADYTGQIAIVNYYSLDYADSTDNQQSELGNDLLDLAAAKYHVEIADGYGAFESASTDSADDTCTAGLLTQLGMPGTCGVHPSYAGASLLAQSILDAIRT